MDEVIYEHIGNMTDLIKKVDEYYPEGIEAKVDCNIDGDGLLMSICDFPGNTDDTSRYATHTIIEWLNTFYEQIEDLVEDDVEKYAENMEDGIRLYISKDGKEEYLRIDGAFIEYAKSSK